jgi:dCMP deaminase
MICEKKAKQYLDLAINMANIFSKDESTKVGAIILAPYTHQILSMGYNGMPRDFDETIKERWERPAKYLFTEHAERNAIYNACRNGTCLENSIIITTMFPCSDCMRGIIQSGIKKIITRNYNVEENERWVQHFEAALLMAKECGIEIMIVNTSATE